MTEIPLYTKPTRAVLVSLTTEKIRKEVGDKGVAKFQQWALDKSPMQIMKLAADRFHIFFVDKRDNLREDARVQIDIMAARTDRKYTTISGMTPTIYLLKIIECDEWIAAGQPSDVSAPKWHLIRAEMARLSEVHDIEATALQAVTSMKQVQNRWEGYAEQRETIRGVSKAKIDKAETADQIKRILKRAEELFEAI